MLCYEKYIGSTTRPLHIREREHFYSIKNGDNSSALGEHFAECHKTTTMPNVHFKILQHTNGNELRLRIQEAYWIQSKQPSLNRKTEQMGTGFLV